MSNDELRIDKKWLAAIPIGFLVVVIGGLGLVLVNMNTGSKGEQTEVPKGSGKIAAPKGGSNSFLGEKGEPVQVEGNKVYIEESKVDDGNLHPFNYYSEELGKTIYFFIVKALDETYRAAANACEVCFDSQKGFKQIGDQIRCENCRIMYSKDQIALQKGGCNPRPINKDVEVTNGRLVINLADVEATADLF